MKRKIYCLFFLAILFSISLIVLRLNHNDSQLSSEVLYENNSKNIRFEKSLENNDLKLETAAKNDNVPSLKPFEVFYPEDNKNQFFLEGQYLEKLGVEIIDSKNQTSGIIAVHISDDKFDSSIENIVDVSQLFYIAEGIQEIRIFKYGFSEYKIKFLPTIEKAEFNSSNSYSTQSLDSNYKRQFFNGLGINVILREDWGAPSESYWSPTIADVNRIVVHHTATGVDMANPSNTVRSIYNFHFYRCSNNNGSYDPNREDCNEPDEIWNDIGYNYLIDPYGNIYEGRAGGNGVVGAHAIPNSGSIGIGMIGTHTSSLPTSQAQESLKKLIGILSKLNNFVPSWQTSIYGHRDYMNTQCPGNILYNNLPQITTDSINFYNSNTYLNSAINNTNVALSEENYSQSNNNTRLILIKNNMTIDQINYFMQSYRGESTKVEMPNIIVVEVPDALVHQYLAETMTTFGINTVQPDYIYSIGLPNN